jgi:hypothetical protein
MTCTHFVIDSKTPLTSMRKQNVINTHEEYGRVRDFANTEGGAAIIYFMRVVV